MDETQINLNQQFIFDELWKRLKVAVEMDDSLSEDPIKAFEIYQSLNMLSQIENIQHQMDYFANSEIEPSILKEIQNQIDEIKRLVNDHSKKLAINAIKGRIKLASVDKKIFERIIRSFEQKHKAHLRIISYMHWLY